MDDATMRERFDAAFARIEAGIAAERARRSRAEARFAMLEAASEEAIAAIDGLVAAPVDTLPAGPA